MKEETEGEVELVAMLRGRVAGHTNYPNLS